MKKTKMETIQTLRTSVHEHQATEIDGVLVDATTANCITKVYDALNEDNRAKLASMPIVKMANICWELVK